MSLTFRRALFAFFSFLFLVVGSAIVLYGLGWRINPYTFKIQKTGAIAIQTEPRGVIIKMGKKEFADKSSIIQNHTLIPDLLPETYQVSIEKDGYRSYRKTITVRPSLVETINAVLLPSQLKTEIVIQPIKGNVIVDIYADENKFIIQNSANGIFYLYNLNNSKTALNITALASNIETPDKASVGKIEKAAFLPFDSNRLLIETANGLKILDTSRLQIENITDGKVLTWSLKNSTIYFAKAKKEDKNITSIFSYDLVFKTQNNVLDISSTTAKLPLKSIKASGLKNKIAFLDFAGGLFIFTPNASMPKKIAHSVKLFEFAPNSKAIAFLDNDGAIGVEFTDNWDSAFRKKPGDVSRFNLTEKQNMEKIKWYFDSLRLFASKNNEISLMEIDDREPLNIYKIESGFNDFFYDGNNSFVYFIKDGKLRKTNIES